MADFSRAVQALQDQISSGKLSEFPLAWQANAILPWWERFEKSVRDHHHHEEDIFFPEIQKRVELPPKMTSGTYFPYSQAVELLLKSFTQGACKALKLYLVYMFFTALDSDILEFCVWCSLIPFIPFQNERMLKAFPYCMQITHPCWSSSRKTTQTSRCFLGPRQRRRRPLPWPP